MNSKPLTRWLKSRLLDQRIRRHYGTAYPRTISLIDSTQSICIDPHDWRARKKIIMATVRGRFPRNQRFWRSTIARLQPDTVLDVGLNYGECLFSMEYGPATRLFAFEANPALKQYVTTSQSMHPNGHQMDLVFQLVTDGADGSEEFFVDRQWSGCSRAGLDPEDYDPSRYEKIRVPRASIDRALQCRGCRPQHLFFKIDIEGFEARALAGMQQTLERASQAVGFLEFNPVLLGAAGTDAAVWWEDLQRTFDVYVFDRQDRVHAADRMSFDALRAVCGRHFHTDVVVLKTTNPSQAGQIFADWETAGPLRSAA